MRTLCLILLTLLGGAAAGEEPVPAHAQVRLETSEGNLLIQLDGRRAPLTTRNFLRLVDSGYYDGTIFHRVIPGFMIQGGGYTRDLKLKEPGDTVANESGNGLENIRGTIAMARTGDPHSAAAQFFINVADNTRLDPQPERWGYAVFGYVIEGMDVADRIVSVPTGPGGELARDVPVAAIIIRTASRVSNDN